MFLAPPVLDRICIRTLDLRLLCFCSHFVDQAIDLVAGLYRCATFSSSSETSRRNGAAQHILLAFIYLWYSWFKKVVAAMEPPQKKGRVVVSGNSCELKLHWKTTKCLPKLVSENSRRASSRSLY